MIHSPYVMHDQVRDLVPQLMSKRPVSPSARLTRRLRACVEIGVFLIAGSSYLAALALAA